ncbi:MAG: hypothetical protein JNJ83_18210 [Verrucomicrobiaceae bacterium]|nr:hypothetical protein [Verrucomicrobiaceae bacterium]
MPVAFSIRPEQAQQAMEQLLKIADVRHVAIVDAIGLCLAHAGKEPVSKTMLNDWTVVARSTFAANDQLGQRSGAGPCVSALSEHREGGTLMRVVAGGMLLITQYGPRTPVSELQQMVTEVAQILPTTVEIKPPSPIAAPVPPVSSLKPDVPAPSGRPDTHHDRRQQHAPVLDAEMVETRS